MGASTKGEYAATLQGGSACKPVQAHSCMPAFTYVKKKVKLNYNIYTHKCLNPEYTSHLGEFVQLNTLTQLPPRGEEIP